MKAIKFRLIVMNFLIFAVWGAYLCSLGIYLGRIGMGANIGKFFAIQGIVSLFMPALMGIVADRWIPAQKLLGICHFLAAIFMALAGYMGYKYGSAVSFGQLFPYYAISVAFFMPTIALGNSVSYNALNQAGLDRQQERGKQVVCRHLWTARLLFVQGCQDVRVLHLLFPTGYVPTSDQRLRHPILGCLWPVAGIRQRLCSEKQRVPVFHIASL